MFFGSAATGTLRKAKVSQIVCTFNVCLRWYLFYQFFTKQFSDKSRMNLVILSVDVWLLAFQTSSLCIVLKINDIMQLRVFFFLPNSANLLKKFWHRPLHPLIEVPLTSSSQILFSFWFSEGIFICVDWILSNKQFWVNCKVFSLLVINIDTIEFRKKKKRPKWLSCSLYVLYTLYIKTQGNG